jgi:hypothetical protein
MEEKISGKALKTLNAVSPRLLEIIKIALTITRMRKEHPAGRIAC